MRLTGQIRWMEQQLGRPKTRYCEAGGCHQATREGKPFCSAHVDQHPYVQGLLGRIASREDEEERVARTGSRAVDPDGITAQEILQFLKVNGPRTVQRLARELNLEQRIVRGYLKALERLDLVNLGVTRRGSIIVRPGSRPKRSSRVRAVA